MPAGRDAEDLGKLLKRLEAIAKRAGPKVSVEEIRDAIGARSFGPLLLLAGLMGMSPVAAIPTAPTILAVIIFLVAGQMLLARESLWLPKVMLKLSVRTGRLRKTTRWLTGPAKVVDRIVKPRLQALTGPVADRAVALLCVVLAAATPPLELLPMAAFVPSAAIAAFGLGLVARDGLVVLVALALSGSALGFGVYQLIR